MNAFVVLPMSLLLMSLLVVSAAASGGQHGASEYRLALSQSITIERVLGIPSYAVMHAYMYLCCDAC